MPKLNYHQQQIMRRIIKKAIKQTYEQYKGAFDKLGSCEEPEDIEYFWGRKEPEVKSWDGHTETVQIKMVGNPTEWEIE